MNKTLFMEKYNTIDFNKYTNYFFIAFAFSIPVSKALISLFMALMLITWLLEGNFKEKFNIIRHDTLSLVFLGLISFSTLAILWSPDTAFAVDFVFRKYWHFLMIPIMLTSFKMKYVKYVFNAFLLSMLISEIISYGIIFHLWTFKDASPQFPTPFMHHVDYSIHLAFALMILITKWFNETQLKWKIFYGGYFLTSLVNLFLNGGRTGQVAFLFTLLLISIVFFRKSYKLVVAAVITTILTITLAYNFSPNFNSRVHQAYTDISATYTEHNFNGSFAARIAMWVVGVNTFIDHPITGTGIGAEMKDIPKYSNEYNFDVKHLSRFTDYHNTFVHYSVQLGIVGLILSISVFISLFRMKIRTRDYQILGFAFTTLFLLDSMQGFTFHILHPLVFLCTFAALFNAIAYKERNLNQPT